MWNSILDTLKTMGWLGVVLLILVFTNTITGMISNIWSGKETFSWKRLFNGIFKSAVFYVCASLISVAFTMLPFINNMIADAFETTLMSSEILNTLSGVGVLGVVVTVVVTQAKKAVENIIRLAETSSDNEIIT